MVFVSCFYLFLCTILRSSKALSLLLYVLCLLIFLVVWFLAARVFSYASRLRCRFKEFRVDDGPMNGPLFNRFSSRELSFG